MRPRDDENTVWTDSQDYGADEILSHPFTVISPVQRAACALHFEGSVPTRINRNRSLNQIPHVIFNLSHLPEGCVPRFSKTRFAPISSLFGELDDGAPDAFAVLHFAFHPVTLSIRQTEGVVPP